MTLKIRSRSPKSEQIFKPSQHYNIWSLARIHHLVQRIGCRQAFFGSKFEIFSFYSVMTLKIRLRSANCDQIFKPSQRYNIWRLARICHLVQETGCMQAFFGQNFKVLVWHWKWGQGYQNLIPSFLPPNNGSVQVWSKSIHWFRR